MRNKENKYPNKLRELRLDRHLTMTQVIAMLELQSANRLSRWEKGQSVPSLKHLLRLGEIYGVSTNEIYQSL